MRLTEQEKKKETAIHAANFCIYKILHLITEFIGVVVDALSSSSSHFMRAHHIARINGWCFFFFRSGPLIAFITYAESE